MPELTTASGVSAFILGDNTLATTLTPYLAAAEDQIAQYCNRRDLGGNHWLSASHTEYIDGEIADGVLLKFTPVTTITSVDNVTSATTSFTYTLTDLEMDGIPIASLSTSVSGVIGRVGLRNTFLTGTIGWQTSTTAGMPWGRYSTPNFGSGRKRVKVVYTGGYQAGSVPASLTHAAKMLTAQMYYNRTRDPTVKSTTLGQFSESYGNVTGSAASELGTVVGLIEPYRCYSNLV